MGSPDKRPRTVEVVTEPPAIGRAGSSPLPPVVRVLGDDGVYEARTTGAGTFVARMETPQTEVREGFYPTVPKAPASLLSRIVHIFKRMPDREAVVSVVYDRREKRHHLIWNDQRDQSSGGVTYDPIPETGRIVPYAEIHSHNRMGAFFSRTDDEFEVRTGIYGVLGRVDEERPEALFRYSCGGVFRPLSGGEVFHNPSGVPVLARVVRDLYFEEPYQ